MRIMISMLKYVYWCGKFVAKDSDPPDTDPVRSATLFLIIKYLFIVDGA
jgi:hypothetical protein